MPNVAGDAPTKSSALSFVKKQTEEVKIPPAVSETKKPKESVIPMTSEGKPTEAKPKPRASAAKSRAVVGDRESLPFTASVSSRVRDDIRQRLETERHLRTLEADSQSRSHRPQYIIDEVLDLGLQQLEKQRSK